MHRERIEKFTGLDQGPLTQANGLGDSETDSDYKFGQMGLDTRANGEITELMGKESSPTLMEMSMKEIG